MSDPSTRDEFDNNTDSDAQEAEFAREATRLRRRSWILAGIGAALIPLVYWLMVEVLLPRFWIEDEAPADVDVSSLAADSQ